MQNLECVYFHVPSRVLRIHMDLHCGRPIGSGSAWRMRICPDLPCPYNTDADCIPFGRLMLMLLPLRGRGGGGVGGRAKYCNGEKIIYKNLFIIWTSVNRTGNEKWEEKTIVYFSGGRRIFAWLRRLRNSTCCTEFKKPGLEAVFERERKFPFSLCLCLPQREVFRK